MELRNRRGRPVDPVPFVVVGSVGFLFCFGFGPFYCTAFGFSLRQGVVLSTVAYAGLVGVAFYRLVWTARPEMRGEVTAARFRQLVRVTLLLTLLLIVLTLPLVV